MYQVDAQDEVHEMAALPPPSAGAPSPLLLSDEQCAVLAYYAADDDDSLALVRFSSCYAVLFGPPNDEAIEGHPLASRGLEPYAAFEVRTSSWIRAVERMNRRPPYHDPR